MRDEYIIALDLTENLNLKKYFEMGTLYADKNTIVCAWILNIFLPSKSMCKLVEAL